MRAEIDVLLAANGGVCTRGELLESVSRHLIDNEVRCGHLVALAPRTYARPWDGDVLAIRELAAVKSAGPDSALSHTSALRRWGLPVPDSADAIHLVTPARQFVRSRDGVVVHRTDRPIVTTQNGNTRVVLVEHALAQSWPVLTGSARRAPAIHAVSRRLTDAGRLRDELTGHARLPGRAQLVALIGLIEAGCQSELELWGYLQVFDAPGLRGAIRQRTVVVGGKVFRLDMAYESEKVAVELDGRGYHWSPMQWERDIARDLALATMGWQTIRLSHRRLTTDVEGCRRDVISVLGRRR